jgi:hypothetical protein
MSLFGVSDGDGVALPRTAPPATPAEERQYRRHQHEHGCGGRPSYSWRGSLFAGYFIECNG